jgi:hypothetical protein
VHNNRLDNACQLFFCALHLFFLLNALSESM